MTKARTLADNYAADINQVSAGVGITGGGTSGTVTITNDMATSINAKGDLVVGTANDTYSRLAVASTAGYLLTVDSAEATGLKWAAPVAGGKVLQVIYGSYSTSTTIASTTMTDTGLSASITPSSTSSKVLIMVAQQAATLRTNNGGQGGKFRILRGSTVVLECQDDVNTSQTFLRAATGDPQNVLGVVTPIYYLDSPSSTSSVTYKTQARVGTTDQSGSIVCQTENTKSLMVLMEIGA